MWNAIAGLTFLVVFFGGTTLGLTWREYRQETSATERAQGFFRYYRSFWAGS